MSAVAIADLPTPRRQHLADMAGDLLREHRGDLTAAAAQALRNADIARAGTLDAVANRYISVLWRQVGALLADALLAPPPAPAAVRRAVSDAHALTRIGRPASSRALGLFVKSASTPSPKAMAVWAAVYQQLNGEPS